jgi:nucleotide-binding universal stress UspA family protein
MPVKAETKVLITLDGSPLAEHALAYIPRLLRPDTKLHLLIVLGGDQALEMALLASSIGHAGYFATDVPSLQKTAPQEEVTAAQNYLLNVADRLRDTGYEVTAEVLEGNVIDTIVATAANGYDAVLMVTHGRTGLSKLALGSVTDGVLRKVNCPVIVVPARAAEA